jgi:hypothetical protein
MYHLVLVVDPLNQKLMQSRRHTPIGVNPIMTQNNIVVTLHLNNEESGSEQLAPHRELHGDDAPNLYRLVPHAI